MEAAGTELQKQLEIQDWLEEPRSEMTSRLMIGWMSGVKEIATPTLGRFLSFHGHSFWAFMKIHTYV